MLETFCSPYISFIFDMELSFVETEIMTKQTIAQGF